MDSEQRQNLISHFEHWYTYSPKSRASIGVNDDGSINFIGSCKLKYAMREHKLPMTMHEVAINFDCSKSNLVSLEGSPRIVGESFLAHENQLESLDGLPDSVRLIRLSYFPTLPLLKILFVKGLTRIEFTPYTEERDQVTKILYKYLGKGQGAALACGAELVRSGFKGNARK